MHDIPHKHTNNVQGTNLGTRLRLNLSDVRDRGAADSFKLENPSIPHTTTKVVSLLGVMNCKDRSLQVLQPGQKVPTPVPSDQVTSHWSVF